MLKNQKKNNKRKFFFILLLLVLLPLCWFLYIRFEGVPPVLKTELQNVSLGLDTSFTCEVTDEKSGLRKFWIAVIKDGKEHVLAEKIYPSAGFLKGGETKTDQIQVLFSPRAIGLTDGPALIRFGAWDRSWRNWFRGNGMYMEKHINIDTRPPDIEILSKRHNINPGGSALVIYRIKEDNATSGVYVDDHFFPGHSGFFPDASIHMAFFALSHLPDTGKDMYVGATDSAGNKSRAGFSHYIRRKNFRTDTINISDRFLDWKMPELATRVDGDSPLTQFLSINTKHRAANAETITGHGRDTVAEILWNGPFERLPRAANRAGFADKRVYKYNGKVIDTQYHLGIDLASVAQSPIPAANAGRVVMADFVGIYGNTVVIDHGFGLQSVYAHMSRMDVSVGDRVAKGEVLGTTGTSGLAAGDHLHFSVVVHDTFVNPLEWWDASWIENNIRAKITDIQARFPGP